MRYPVQIENVDGIMVVRDDLIQGGSKRRVLAPVMENLRNRHGYSEFVYGGPAEGYAQLALAYAAQEIGANATYFVAKRKVLHPYTREAKQTGCRIAEVEFGRLNVVKSRARRYCQENGAFLFPFGFSMPEFEARLTEEIREALEPIQPSEIWCVAGSGLLSRCLQSAVPTARVNAVRIGTPPSVGGATLFEAPEKFAEPAEIAPPFPSCTNYDAKAWRFIKQRASEGALFWTVGR